MGIYKNTNAHEVLTNSLNYFTFVSHIFFLDIFHPLSIPCLAIIYFENAFLL